MFKLNDIISNEQINKTEITTVSAIIKEMQCEISSYVSKGFGPFLAAIYDKNGKLIAKCANSVVNENCSNNHAEVNAIKSAEKYFDSYDLSPYNLSLYVTSEPCMMCLGAIMWSGIKSVYYGVKSEDVEKITGYDEGFKPNWFEEFSKRGITVYGNIESELGKKVLMQYVSDGNIIYKPQR